MCIFLYIYMCIHWVCVCTGDKFPERPNTRPIQLALTWYSCAAVKIPTVVKAAGMMLPWIHITLLAGCKLAQHRRYSAATRGCPTLFNRSWALRGFYRLDRSRTKFQTLSRWQRGRREKKPRNWMSSIRPFCPNCWEKTTTSIVLTVRQKVSLLCKPHVRNVFEKMKWCWKLAANGLLKLAMYCNGILMGVT